MKRKRNPRKLTTSQLAAAGFGDLATHLRERFAVSVTGRPPFQDRKLVRKEGRSFIDPNR